MPQLQLQPQPQIHSSGLIRPWLCCSVQKEARREVRELARLWRVEVWLAFKQLKPNSSHPIASHRIASHLISSHLATNTFSSSPPLRSAHLISSHISRYLLPVSARVAPRRRDKQADRQSVGRVACQWLYINIASDLHKNPLCALCGLRARNKQDRPKKLRVASLKGSAS